MWPLQKCVTCEISENFPIFQQWKETSSYSFVDTCILCATNLSWNWIIIFHCVRLSIMGASIRPILNGYSTFETCVYPPRSDYLPAAVLISKRLTMQPFIGLSSNGSTDIIWISTQGLERAGALWSDGRNSQLEWRFRVADKVPGDLQVARCRWVNCIFAEISPWRLRSPLTHSLQCWRCKDAVCLWLKSVVLIPEPYCICTNRG